MGQSSSQAFRARESETKLKQADKYWERQKWLVIYNAMIDPRPAAEIARHAECQKDLYVKSSNNTTVKVKPLDQVKAVGGTVI